MNSTATTNKLYIFAIILLCLALGYAYYIYFATQETMPPLTASVMSDSLKNLKINWSIISDKKYTALEQFGESPVNPGVTGGRQDIFAP